VGRRTVTTVVFVVAISALSSACSNTNPTTPSNTTDNGQTSSNPALVSRLQITSMGLTDAGPSARGDWLYEARVYLRETGGVDVTITNLQIQVLLDSKVLGAARSTPMLSMTANSSRDTALVVAADTHVQVSALTTTVTVQFTDAKGNTGSINSSGSCAGCWDY
jgi:hypothetical protein